MNNIAFSLLLAAIAIAWSDGKPWGDTEYEIDTDENDDRLPANGELFEGDIVMDERLRQAVWGQQSKKSALRKVKDDGFKWPNGIIYYEVDVEFPADNHDMLNHAIQEFHIRTCIRFHKRVNETDYIYFTASKDECSSSIGRTGGKQTIYLGIHCLVLGTFLHESMHALGFIHEHSRPDRDEYLKVKYENIKPTERNNFNKYTVGEVDNLHATFDFMSVLLYRNDAFTNNGEDTLEALANPQLEFGQRIKFSVGDVKEINRLYNCKKEQKDPNYKGLFKEVHYKAKKKRRDEGKLKAEMVMDYLEKMRRILYARERDMY